MASSFRVIQYSIGVRAARTLVLAGILASTAACTTTGRAFDTSEMHRIIPGTTTLEEASAVLKSDPEIVYRQLDGTATARWSSKNSVLPDALYFRRELSLRFDSEGRYERIVDRINVIGDTGTPPRSAAHPIDAIDQAMPQTVHRGFPYGPAQYADDSPVMVLPVR